MRLLLACAWILILAKKVHNRDDCLRDHFNWNQPGELYEEDLEFRHFIFGKAFSSHTDCGYSSVKVLKIQYCPVESIESDFFSYGNVSTLDISFSNYTSLEYLRLSFERLNRLNVSHNALKEVHEHLFHNTKQLIDVDISYNQIKNLDELTFSKVPQLKTINISHNRIEEIDSRLFAGLPDLEVLDLSDNKIEKIPSDAFGKNAKLKQLNVNNNPILRLNCDVIKLLNGTTSINVSSDHLIAFDLSCVNPVEWATNEEEIIFMNTKNKNVLRLPKTNFKNLKEFDIHGNRLKNPFAIVNMLGESMQYLLLEGNHLGQLNETTFNGLNNLAILGLSRTNLSFGESNPFEHLNNLTALGISHNNLRTLNVSLFAKTLNNLVWFKAAGNQFDNGLEIIHSLGPNLRGLGFSENFIGPLNRSTFERFESLILLNLSDTHLEHFDVNLSGHFHELDISRNKLKRLNVTLLSDTLNGLWRFFAADNEFENMAEIIQHLGLDLTLLDLSGSYVSKLDVTTLEHLRGLDSLTLRRTNLLISEFESFRQLIKLDISNNNLTGLNFSTLSILEYLMEINLSENHLTQLDGLTRRSYPKLSKLDITNNKLNCTYLSAFRKEWKELEIVGDPCIEYENNTIQSQSDTSVEKTSVEIITENNTSIQTFQTEREKQAHTEFTVAPEKSMPSSIPVVLYAVPIGVSALIINIIGVVVFLRRKSSSRNRNQMTVSYNANAKGEEQQPELQAQREVESKPEDHIYEEIQEREQPYDHLRFEFSPIPISTENQHYHNFTLANRATQS